MVQFLALKTQFLRIEFTLFYNILHYYTLLYAVLDQTYNIAKYKLCNAQEFCLLQIMSKYKLLITSTEEWIIMPLLYIAYIIALYNKVGESQSVNSKTVL